MAVVENRFVCDLSKPVQAQALKGNVFSLDNLGSRLSVLIYNNGQPATISGSITANCILPDGSTVNVNGGLTTENGGSKAYVDIPQSCLLIPGILKIAIKCTSSSVITTLAAIVANVYMTKTDNVITPSQQIITDWNAEISASLANQDAEISDIKSATAQGAIIEFGGQLIQNTGYYIKNNQAVGSYCDVSYHVENANYACVLAEHIAKGQKFYIIGQVTGSAGLLYAWLNSAHEVVSNSGSTYSTTGKVIECPVNDGTLVVSANTSDVALKVLTIKEESNDLYAYFSNGLMPTFSGVLNNASSSISVVFPNAEFRLYRKDGTRLVATTAYTNQTFTVTNLQKLIYDIPNNIVKVVSITAIDPNTVTLLAVMGEGIVGAFACFYNRSTQKQDWNKTQLLAYFSGGQSPYFQVINTSTTAKVKVLFPNADFRIYGLTGMFYQTSSFGGTEFEIETLKKLVYDITNNTISVVSNTASGNYINLLSVEGQGFSGLLAKYFYANNDYYTRQEQYDIYSAYYSNDLRILFYSDVHGSSENVKRIINKAICHNVDAIVCGGDVVTSNIGQGLSWYEELAATTTKDMLTCVGNHDVWSNADTQTLATKSDVYNAVIAPMVSRVSDIVQPTGASSNYDLYFYKDYSGIRMIFLDAMVTTGGTPVGWWDGTQLAWLESVLADAKTNSKSVVIVAHPPFNKNIAIRDNASPVNSWIDYRNYSVYEGIHLPEAAMDAVKDFIDGGGKFICWLSGHVHVDSLLTATGYTGQVMINIMSARYNYHPDGTAFYLSAYSREKWFDSYDYIAFDTTHKMIKVVRIGYCEDGAMRKRERFCYDYGNNVLMSVS